MISDVPKKGSIEGKWIKRNERKERRKVSVFKIEKGS